MLTPKTNSGFIIIAISLALLPWTSVRLNAQSSPTVPTDLTDAQQFVAKIAAAAKSLINAVDDRQQKSLLFDFTDIQQRERWSNLPTGIFERKGLRMGDLTPPQKQAVLALIRATLSKAGYQQVIDNINGEEFLAQNSRRGGRVIFGEDEYYVSILGDPSNGKPWMWQFGGHHLAINATIVADQVTIAPSLTGGQPADYQWKGKLIRQVALEEDTAYEFINSLPATEKQAAIQGDTFTDLQFGPTAKSTKISKTGIALSKLSPPQQATVKKLIQARVGILNPVHAELAMKRIVDDFDKTYFAWYGSTEPGKPATYRIQGPTVIIEYAPQRMRGSGDPTSHIHAMYRDPTNDYGVKLIKEIAK